MSESQQRQVRNRDIAKLGRVYYLMQDIVSLERRRQWEKERMQNITAHLSGIPGGGANPKGFEDAFAALSETEERHRLLVKQYVRELKRCEDAINGIEDSSLRTFVTMLYLDKLPGAEVRGRLNMTRRQFETARNMIEQAETLEEANRHRKQWVWIYFKTEEKKP